MLKKFKYIIIIILILNFFNLTIASENFFHEAEKKYIKKKIEESKLLFQRNIVFNPKHAESYLYLAKIYNLEENKKKEQKNLNTALLLAPNNEEAIYMLIELETKKSNYSKVKELTKKFEINCRELCSEIETIKDKLKNIESKNESNK